MHHHQHFSMSYKRYDDGVDRWERLEFTEEPMRRAEQRRRPSSPSRPDLQPLLAFVAGWVRGRPAASPQSDMGS